MHLLAILFFTAVMMFSLAAIGTMIRKDGNRMWAALLGQPVPVRRPQMEPAQAAHSNVVVLRPIRRRSPDSLPLAA